MPTGLNNEKRRNSAQGTPKKLIDDFGRQDLEQVFIDIARQDDTSDQSESIGRRP